MIDPAADEVTRREDLAAAARELKAEVVELRAEVSNLNTRTGRAEKATFRSSVVIGVLMLIVVGVGVIAWQNYQTSQRLAAVVAEQHRQSERVWCPFYSLILGSYSPGTRELNPDGSYEGSDRQQYIDGFEGPLGLRAQYSELPCTGGLIPPRTGS